MKIVITGSKGQLGNEIRRVIKAGFAEIGTISEVYKESEVIPLDREELDITNFKQVKETLDEIKADVVINCAAYTKVDVCEENEDIAFKVNAIGPRNLAIGCEAIGAKLVQISTDYVFSGEDKRLLKEYDATVPCSVYGKSKLQGENFVKEFSNKYFIVRTAWLYGYIGNNFVYTMMKLGKTRDELKVVNDQLGNPTSANDLSYEILKVILTEEYGTYHCTGKGECTWYDFANKIMKLSNIDCEVLPCTSEEFSRLASKKTARRPEYSSLDNMMLRCTIGDEMRRWELALENFINNVIK
ncbi:dTDP-4-dehydrorhamnose reductase [Clostridium cavendishii DSM 21758]|uniref:dTDP-4-dehydrorhamnose reductase n=1 Tax=Clostridium cavendishii DSM 21758 TaxID=1121302 RepID=A0A1M6QCX6_9CLOT|nr:dTDP-4-dehydrorhamnose reductase [Clostridium cavendishii]SHK17970.1 dTDP-4-dehydrorhamnose reductase [Clostridium cavendishii DSM 21758]